MTQQPEVYSCTTDCLHIELGCSVFIQCQGSSERLKFDLIGLAPGRYLIVAPSGATDPVSLLKDNQEVVVRYLHRGEVLGFRTTVLKQLDNPYPLIFLAYPKTVERFNLRKDARITCNLPVAATVKDQKLSGVITDISLGGCRVVLRSVENLDSGLFLPEASLLLDFTVPGGDGPIHLKCLIRNAHLAKEKIEVGVEFSETEDPVKHTIERYINQVGLVAPGR
jgi:c-di-GMP-binding flagellar brake protein YcgR